MKTDNVTSAKQRDDRSIELTILDPIDGTTKVHRYATIRGGISWPTAKAPAYYCVVGQKFITADVMAERVPAGPRILLGEYEAASLSLSNFYSKITDIASQFLCRDFYVVLPEARWACGFENDFYSLGRERNSKATLQAAYDSDNFTLGISRIRDSIDKQSLIIPKDSTIYTQLRGLTKADLEDSPEERYYAINGLRHVISSFYRAPPVTHHRYTSRLQKRLRVLSRGTFMSQ